MEEIVYGNQGDIFYPEKVLKKQCPDEQTEFHG
jgi:hypothetical protein